MRVLDVHDWLREDCGPFPLGTVSITDEAMEIVDQCDISLEHEVMRHVEGSPYGKPNDPYKNIEHRVVTTTITASAKFPDGTLREIWIISSLHKQETVICMELEVIEFLTEALP